MHFQLSNNIMIEYRRRVVEQTQCIVSFNRHLAGSHSVIFIVTYNISSSALPQFRMHSDRTLQYFIFSCFCFSFLLATPCDRITALLHYALQFQFRYCWNTLCFAVTRCNCFQPCALKFSENLALSLFHSLQSNFCTHCSTVQSALCRDQ